MALITCPECNNTISESARHCPKCGANLGITASEKINIIVKIGLLIALAYGGLMYLKARDAPAPPPAKHDLSYQKEFNICVDKIRSKFGLNIHVPPVVPHAGSDTVTFQWWGDNEIMVRPSWSDGFLLGNTVTCSVSIVTSQLEYFSPN